MNAPVSTTNLAKRTALSDELIVNRDGSTAIQRTSDLASQIAGNGAVADEFSAVRTTLNNSMQDLGNRIEAAAEGYKVAVSWAQLVATPGAQAGQPGRVATSDAGTHTDPVVGGTVPNSGEYRWSGSAWQRIGDFLDPLAVETGIAATPKTGPDIEGEWEDVVFDLDGKVVSGKKRGGATIDMRSGAASIISPASSYLFQGSPGYQFIENVTYMVLVMGQSLAQGYNTLETDATVTTSPEHPGAAMMFDVGTRPGGRTVNGFTDLFEQLYRGSKETVCSGMADVIMRGLGAALGKKPEIVFAISAEGGVRYAGQSGSNFGLKRGANEYEEAIRLVRRAAEIAAGRGKRLIVPALVLAHGETDTAVPTERWQYRRALSQLRFDIEAEVRLVTGQNEPVRGYAYQPCRGSSVVGAHSQVAEAILDAQDFDPGWRCVGPNYFAPDSTGGGVPGAADVDNAHASARGYRRIGRMFGFALLNDLFGPWFTPLRVLEHWWISPTVFALKYPYPIAIETDDSMITISTLGAGKGIDFTDGSGSSPTVTGIAVSSTDNTVLEVTLSAAPNGLKKRVFIASRRTANSQGPVHGIRSGVRSSDPYDTDSSDGAALFHWACTESISL
ncbi:hypothetical protein [Agrobacterium tumefaciens]|uniref:hypothetical protein n=1 Tax=Agrobacterium tumefaciens TaxID=358 RepID=UPI0004594796|nr:hypothetical protein [Agrobacterium tumefaciens]CDN93415.1 hypothetical protein BN949_02569 [Agrobacterium tumefaciens]